MRWRDTRALTWLDTTNTSVLAPATTTSKCVGATRSSGERGRSLETPAFPDCDHHAQRRLHRVVALAGSASVGGPTCSRASMLLFRDIAAPKADAIAQIPELLATGDPAVVRDVGAFLARGEVSLRYGNASVDAGTAAIAWELAACDLGYPCGPFSRMMLWQCAFKGYCDAYRYDEAVARDEDPQRMALAQRLRGGLVSALRRQDWNWLGLGAGAGGGADSGGGKKAG